jgi:DNA-binding transcriptional LysR family regulator
MQKSMARGPRQLRAKDLELLLVLHQQKTITAAARALGLEQSTLSRQLVDLEDRLGFVLFSRHRTGLFPSSRALSILPLAEQQALLVRQANRCFIEPEKEALAPVHLTCPDVIADRLLAPAIGSLLLAYPTLKLRITSSDELADLGRLEADLAIRIGQPPRGDVVSVKISESPLRVYGLPRYLPRAGRASLRALPVLHRSETASPDSRLLRRLAPDAISLSSNRMTTCLLAAESGAGVVILPKQFGDLLQNLVEIPVDPWPDPLLSIYLGAPRAVRKRRSIQLVWDWARTLFQGGS